MRKNIAKIIRVFAVIMFVVGLYFSVGSIAMCAKSSNSDDISWFGVILLSLSALFSSVFAYGFSYIVEASVRYLDKEK